MPSDLTRAEIDYQPVGDVRLPGYQPTTEGNSEADPARRQGARQRAPAGALRRRRRDQRQRGDGAARARAADRLPVTCTLMGLGALPGAAPAVARHARHARHARGQLRDGRGGPDRRHRRPLRRPHHRQALEFAPRAKFVHIDIDPAEISKNVPAHIPIVGDAKNVLARLTNEYRALGPDPTRLASWWERIDQWRQQYPLRYDDSPDTTRYARLWRATAEASTLEASSTHASGVQSRELARWKRAYLSRWKNTFQGKSLCRPRGVKNPPARSQPIQFALKMFAARIRRARALSRLSVWLCSWFC